MCVSETAPSGAPLLLSKHIPHCPLIISPNKGETKENRASSSPARSRERKELGLKMYEDMKRAVPWLVQYLKPTGETVRKMTESMNKLRSRMQPVARKLLEICENGWSPRESTIEWIHKGLDYSTRVQVIVDRYVQLRDRHTGSSSAAEAMLHCPFDAVLVSRQINMDALGLIVEVMGHYTDGETYEKEDYDTVAISAGASYPDVLQDLYNLIPKVKQLERYSEELFCPCPRPRPGPGAGYHKAFCSADDSEDDCSADDSEDEYEALHILDGGTYINTGYELI